MTIKELEEKTGLARANIRYYEQQGLLHPARQENGYRDYSEEDLQTLRKIKLLRHLGLGIETIRVVQHGEQTLDAALAAREEELEKEAAMLGKEQTVCRELRQQRIAYAALEPESYLLELEREEKAARGALAVPRPEQGDIIKPLQHPWRRFFARNLDWALCGWLWQLVGMGVLGINGSMEPAYSLLGWCMALLLMLALEPVLLSRFGTTPGKWLFGLQVRNIYGEKLSYDQALRRTWMVLLWGMGLNFVAVNVYFNWKSYEECMAGKPAVWDENTAYTIRDVKTWRIVVCLFLYAAFFVGAFWYAAQKSTPHSAAGELTREAFIAACNESIQLDDDSYHLFLDGNGNWQLTEQTLRENPNAMRAGYGAEMDYEILLDEEQHVEGVRITIEGSENEDVCVDDLIR